MYANRARYGNSARIVAVFWKMWSWLGTFWTNLLLLNAAQNPDLLMWSTPKWLRFFPYPWCNLSQLFMITLLSWSQTNQAEHRSSLADQLETVFLSEQLKCSRPPELCNETHSKQQQALHTWLSPPQTHTQHSCVSIIMHQHNTAVTLHGCVSMTQRKWREQLHIPTETHIYLV